MLLACQSLSDRDRPEPGQGQGQCGRATPQPEAEAEAETDLGGTLKLGKFTGLLSTRNQIPSIEGCSCITSQQIHSLVLLYG